MELDLFGTLGVIFIVLKLVGVINWPWIWVLAPFWIGFVIFILFVCLMLLIEMLANKY